MSVQATSGKGPKGGPKYRVDIEGTLHDWDRSTITVAEIIELGGWPHDQGVIEVDLDDNTERTLEADDVIELKPGKGFAKKVKFKRG